MKRPLVSPYVDRCIEKAMTTTDFAGYETYNNPEIQCVGAINVADSLTAIKKLVFDEKKVTIEELLEALENNWEGREDLRQMCLNASKYGNDNAEADEMAKWVHHKSQGVLGKHKDYWGGQVRSQGGVMSAYYSFGRACQATPDGRVESQPFADGTASPMAGMDKKGPTATLSSLSKLDPMLANEMLCNQKFMPQFLEGENKKLFADYLKTWYDMGNWHIQFNVVDKEVLINAQDHPEIYPDLVVRVAGYSAYWVDLGKPLQDDIIKRSEQSFASC
jgi:formate C-acetyltransferase